MTTASVRRRHVRPSDGPALRFGLLPPDWSRRSRPARGEGAARGGHLSVGFMGVAHLLPGARRARRPRHGLLLLNSQTFPSGGIRSAGARPRSGSGGTARTDGRLPEPRHESFNHYGLGAVGDWIYRGVGGLAPAAPGYQRLLIAPKPGGTLTAATTSLLTGYGQTRTQWSRSGGSLTLSVVVPPNTTATIEVPAPSAAAVTAPAEAVPHGFASGVASYSLARVVTFTASSAAVPGPQAG